MSQRDIISVLKNIDQITVRDLVSKLKEDFRMGPKNQEVLRTVLKIIVVHKKNEAGISVVELKDEYK